MSWWTEMGRWKGRPSVVGLTCAHCAGREFIAHRTILSGKWESYFNVELGRRTVLAHVCQKCRVIVLTAEEDGI